MLLPSLFLTLVFIFISSPLCFSSFQDDPLGNFLDQTPGYDLSAYPSFFGTVHEDQSDEFEAGFGKLKMDYHAEIVDSTRYDRMGTPVSGLGEVNVDDFGAEGDGKTDDTEVP